MGITYFHTISDLRNFLEEHNPSVAHFITDENCNTHCLSRLYKKSNAFVFPAGEQYKTISTYTNAVNYLAEANTHRSHLIAAIGGGLVNDLTGFLAATYKRGIPCIYIPTSLMAMVDASIGGKTGINHEHLKNYIGTFSQPAEILICPPFLQTLPERELMSGFAEVVKHGLIGNKTYWNECINLTPLDLKAEEWLPIIQYSANYKSSIVQEDPTEQGVRKILNFGHTIGHALETYLLKANRSITHGEAVAAGMLCEAHISNELNNLPSNDMEVIIKGLMHHFTPLDITSADIDSIIRLTQYDKKNNDHGVQMALLNSIGGCDISIPVDSAHMYKALKFYAQLK